MNNFIILEKKFEDINKNSEVEITLNDEKETCANGKVFGNNLKQLHIIDEAQTDTTIRYEQIKFVKVFL